jgi:pimeloyl-ACP methyl ester carboxylesterase
VTIFLLVHGSEQGGWIWKPTAARLNAAGHEVYTPTLQGFAERDREKSDAITAESIAAELVDLLYYQDLWNVVLVATSVGGIVACHVAAASRERIARIVFIDALVLFEGERVGEIVRPESKPTNFADTDFDDPALAGWARARATRSPARLIGDPVHLDGFWERSWRSTIFRCTRSGNPVESHQRRTATRLGGTYIEIDCGHYPMLTDPDTLVPLLVNEDRP